MYSLLNYTRRPDVTFYPSGRIDINARVAKLLSLREGDVIDIATDGEEYRLYVSRRGPLVGNHEAMVRPSKKHYHNFRCYSKRLSLHMMRAHGGYDFRGIVRMPVGECSDSPDYGKMVSLIVKMNIPKSKQQ